MSDSLRELNNYLQVHRRGNLASQLSWEIKQEGPNNQAIHHVTLVFRDVVVGKGMGTSIGRAKIAAATQALQYFQNNGCPE